MKLLGVILIWLGVLVMLGLGSGMLAFIGFFAVIYAGFSAMCWVIAYDPNPKTARPEPKASPPNVDNVDKDPTE